MQEICRLPIACRCYLLISTVLEQKKNRPYPVLLPDLQANQER